MRGLDPHIHVCVVAKAWMAGPSPAKPGHDEPYQRQRYLNSSDLMMIGTTLVSSITLPIST